MLRFGLVGGLNTLVDLAILNCLLWLFPTDRTFSLLAYSSLAYSIGAINSFLLNKYWTFRQRQKTTSRELVRFALATLFGTGWSTLILWLASLVLHPYLVSPTIWANVSKVIAIGGTALISYLAMRLWVFVRPPSHRGSISTAHASFENGSHEAVSQHGVASNMAYSQQAHGNLLLTTHSLSVVLPVYNEADSLDATLKEILTTLDAQFEDFEVILVNDGSRDATGAILAASQEAVPCVRVITHEHNQGYGTTLADGFAAATKELTFFMDSDGQFDIHDLSRLLAYIDEYDAVIGYRVHRQDTWMRKLNAWGWKQLIRAVLGVHVCDIDCAFKLLHTDFLHRYPLETRGAMINAELLSRLIRSGYTYREVPIHHLPRKGGRATGANLRVIARAFYELFIYTRTCRYQDNDRHLHMLTYRRHHLHQ
jgi:putative flippase GtrA